MKTILRAINNVQQGLIFIADIAIEHKKTTFIFYALLAMIVFYTYKIET